MSKSTITSPWIRGISAAAEYFSVKPDAIKRFLRDGLPAHKRGKWNYFHVDEIDNWMLSQPKRR